MKAEESEEKKFLEIHGSAAVTQFLRVESPSRNEQSFVLLHSHRPSLTAIISIYYLFAHRRTISQCKYLYNMAPLRLSLALLTVVEWP
jgi:hypothetical protein